jgi:hypothetical protein
METEKMVAKLEIEIVSTENIYYSTYIGTAIEGDFKAEFSHAGPLIIIQPGKGKRYKVNLSPVFAEIKKIEEGNTPARILKSRKRK